MRITFKDGVDFTDMHIDVWYAVFICAMCLSWTGVKEMVLTSGREGEHKPGSLHFDGRAFDFRRWDLAGKDVDGFMANVKMCLGRDWDLVLEDTHFHCELDPKEDA